MVETLLSSAALIGVLALMRPLLKGHIRPGLQYALWLAVLARLLVPVSWFASPVSVASAAAPVVERVESVSRQPVSAVGERLAETERTETAAAASQTAETAASGLSLRELGQGIWIAGSVGMAAWFIAVNVRLTRGLRRTRRIYAWREGLPVYVAEGLPSPCLCGVLQPAIYLTEQAVSDPAQAEEIIAHELTHWHHGDNIWALLRVLCLTAYWFDPFVWLAAALSRRDCELCCDAATVKALGEERRYDYGRTLLGMATVKTRPGDLLCGATTMTGTGRSLKERITMIAKGPKTSVLMAAAALCVAAVAVGCTFSGAASEEVYEPHDEAFYAPYLEAAEANGFEGWYETGNEFFDYYIEYLYAYKTGWEEFSSYLLFVNDYAREMGQESFTPLQFGYVQSMEQINDGLYAFLAYMQDSPEQEIEPCWNFVGRLDGRLYVFRNADSVPEELSQGFDPDAYPYLGEGEVLGNADQMFLYWGELLEVFSGFLEPANVEVYLSDGYTPAEYEYDFSMSLEDLIYSSDGWEIRYEDAGLPANDPEAVIKVEDGTGRTLYVWEDIDEMVITGGPEGDVYVTNGSTGRELIDSLLDWALALAGEEGTAPAAEAEAEREDSGDAAAQTFAGETAGTIAALSAGGGNTAVTAPTPTPAPVLTATPVPTASPVAETGDGETSVTESGAAETALSTPPPVAVPAA